MPQNPTHQMHALLAAVITMSGMRQVGVLAAAGLVALDEMIDRLAEDHTHIQQFTNAFRDIPGIQLVNDHPVTNMLHFTLTEQAAFSADALPIKKTLFSVTAMAVSAW